ncbi:MAG: DNA repair protein RecO [Elusimicrobia bacterium]|nr:DNA repair protein RecO [Elusimicrobiota bacterium]
MIRNDDAVVLGRGDAGEYGRWAALLSAGHGLLSVRFAGVNRSAGKLKALSEPMVWGEYRLFFSARSPAVHVTGGRIASSFPGLRADLARTLTGLSLCEMTRRLAAERVPCPAKYRLLCGGLRVLDEGPSPWLETAFGLKLLEAAGYSLRELPVPPAEGPLWRALHEAPLESLGEVPWRPEAGRRFLRLVHEHVEAHAERPLRCGEVARRLELFAAKLRNLKESVPC